MTGGWWTEQAYYRRGEALMALGKCKEALKDFKAVRQLKPNDRDALEKFKACEKEARGRDAAEMQPRWGRDLGVREGGARPRRR